MCPGSKGFEKKKGLSTILTKTRWLLLKRPEHLTDKQETRLSELLKYNLRSVRSYLLNEEFQLFWKYISPYWAGAAG
ncbi:transposase [Nitrosomonas sp. Nm58]|uniref:transposase n=1 Tax=Nitrosomonas sp. Nm58 TaxID=200126 RepID=UPI000B86CA14